MEKFNVLSGIAAPFPRINVDTDLLVPKQYLRTIVRTGLGRIMFEEIRYTPDGKEIADFVLNKEPYRHAKILIAGDNFGCGSSREHAAWALEDMGVKVVIAPSFSDIFSGNAYKNGILLVALPQDQIDRLMEVAATDEIHVDLDTQTVTTPFQDRFSFPVDPFRKHCLSNGLDEIGLTLGSSGAIDAYEGHRQFDQPWLVPAAA